MISELDIGMRTSIFGLAFMAFWKRARHIYYMHTEYTINTVSIIHTMHATYTIYTHILHILILYILYILYIMRRIYMLYTICTKHTIYNFSGTVWWSEQAQSGGTTTKAGVRRPEQ